MQCPKCKNLDLKEVKLKHSNVKVDRCRRCKGVWFDSSELEAVLDVASKELEIPVGAKKSGVNFCPCCQMPLYRFEYPQTYVKIEMCKKCGGLWLDSGEYSEIKAVRQALEKKGKLEEYAQPTGVKGALLRFVDTSIEALMKS